MKKVNVIKLVERAVIKVTESEQDKMLIRKKQDMNKLRMTLLDAMKYLGYVSTYFPDKSDSSMKLQKQISDMLDSLGY